MSVSSLLDGTSASVPLFGSSLPVLSGDVVVPITAPATSSSVFVPIPTLPPAPANRHYHIVTYLMSDSSQPINLHTVYTPAVVGPPATPAGVSVALRNLNAGGGASTVALRVGYVLFSL